jgi:hypothetical protein
MYESTLHCHIGIQKNVQHVHFMFFKNELLR